MTQSLSDAIDDILDKRGAIIDRLVAIRDRYNKLTEELRAVMLDLDDRRTYAAVEAAECQIDTAVINELTNGAIPAAEAWRDRAAEDARGERDEAICVARMP